MGVVATFPQNTTKDFLYKPGEEKATLYYYEKGGKLYGDFGASPAFRIAWPFFWWLLGNSILVRGGGIAGMHQRCLPEELPDSIADHRQRCRSHATQFLRRSIARPCHLQAHRGGQKAARDSAAPEMRSCRSQKRKKQAHFVQLFFGRSPLYSILHLYSY